MAASKRFRDAAGKLYCESCAQAMQKRQAAPAVQAAPLPVAHAPAPPLPSRSPIAQSESSDYSLAPVAEPATRAPCPKCASSFQPGKAECPLCGFDPASVPLNPEKAREVLGDFDAHPDDSPHDREERRRRKSERDTASQPKARTCTHCGYELTGLKPHRTGGVRCPECNTLNSAFSRREADEQLSNELAREAVRKPLIYLFSGCAIYITLVLIHAVQAANSVSPAAAATGAAATGLNIAAAITSLIVWSVIILVSTAIGVAMFMILCKLLHGGVDTHFGHTLLNVAAAMTCAMSVVVLMWFFVGGFFLLFPLGVAVFTYAAILGDLNDFDLRDSRLIAGATWAIIITLAWILPYI